MPTSDESDGLIGGGKHEMKEITELLSNPIGTLVTVICVFVAAKYLYELFKWYKETFVLKKHKDLSNDEDFHEQVSHIACVSQEHTSTLEKFTGAIADMSSEIKNMNTEMNKRFDVLDEERKADIVANGRASLYHLYEELRGKNSLTISEYETFESLANRYLAADGNGPFKNKIIPEILNKPIIGE